MNNEKAPASGCNRSEGEDPTPIETGHIMTDTNDIREIILAWCAEYTARPDELRAFPKSLMPHWATRMDVGLVMGGELTVEFKSRTSGRGRYRTHVGQLLTVVVSNPRGDAKVEIGDYEWGKPYVSCAFMLGNDVMEGEEPLKLASALTGILGAFEDAQVPA